MAARLRDDVLEDAERLVGNFVRPTVAEKQLAAKHDISIRQARRYLGVVRERWRSSPMREAELRERRAMIRRAAEEQYGAAVGANDRRGAIQALRLLMDLDGAGAPQRIEGNVQQGGVVGVSVTLDTSARLTDPAYIRQRLRELLAEDKAEG